MLGRLVVCVTALMTMPLITIWLWIWTATHIHPVAGLGVLFGVPVLTAGIISKTLERKTNTRKR